MPDDIRLNNLDIGRRHAASLSVISRGLLSGSSLSGVSASAANPLASGVAPSLSPGFWPLVLMLAACGGGGGGGGGPTTSGTPAAPAAPSEPAMVQKSGVAHNKPFSGGVAWLDVNNNQRIDEGDYRIPGETNEQGEYSGQVPAEHQNKAVMIDTTNTELAGQLPATLLSLPGARIVSPITHGLARKTINRENLPEQYDPLQENAYEETDDPIQKAVREAVKKILPKFTPIIKEHEDNRAGIQSNPPENARDIEQQQKTETQEKLKPLVEELKQEVEAIENPPKLTVTNNARLNEGTLGSDTPIGVTITVTDADSDETGYSAPVVTVSDTARFKIDGNKLVAKSGATFTSGETINLTITATDGNNPARTDTETISFTVVNVNDPTTGTVSVGGLTGSNVQTGNVVTAQTQLNDPDDDRLDLTYKWQKQQDDGHWANLENTADQINYQPETAGIYRVKVTATDSVFKTKTPFFSTEFTVTAPIAPPQPVNNQPPTLIITLPSQPIEVAETIGTSVTQRINTNIAVAAHDPEGNLRALLIQSQQNGQWVNDDRFEVRDGTLFVKAGQQFDYEDGNNPGGTITLRITASDGTNPGVVKTTTVQLTNQDDPATASVGVTKQDAASPQDWPTLTAATQASDVDGVASEQVTWFRDGNQVMDDQNNPVTGTSIVPGQAGSWHAVLTVTDGLGNEVTTTSAAVEVTAPRVEQQQMTTATGYVYDGPIKGAIVYKDVNGDGVLDARDEFVGVSDSSGRFSGSISTVNADKRYIVDLRAAIDLGDDEREGTADDRDLSQFGIWLAPKGANVVSALTHMIAQGTMTQTIRDALEQQFPLFDPLQHNPFGVAANGVQDDQFKALRKWLPILTDIVYENRALINEHAQKIARQESLTNSLQQKVGDLQQRLEDFINGADPVLTQSGNLTLTLAETNSSTAADTGLRFSVSDLNNNFTNSLANLAISDNRFEFRQSGNEWQLWVKAGQSFTSREVISLTLTATDNTNRTGELNAPIVVTVTDVQHAPELLLLGGDVRLKEGTLARNIDIGLTIVVSDADSGEPDFLAPRVLLSGDGRFAIQGNRIVALNEAIFQPGEEVNLTVTARDVNNNSLSVDKTVSFTIINVNHNPVLTKSGSFNADSLKATNSSTAADTGLRLSVSDADQDVGSLLEFSDDRFHVRPATDNLELWVGAGETFEANESIVLTITATDATGLSGSIQLVLQVLAAESNQPSSNQPSSNQPSSNQPEPLPTDLTIHKALQGAEQKPIYETPGSSSNESPVFTGYILSVSKDEAQWPNFFQEVRTRPEGQTTPSYIIDRKLSDGTYVTDDRFVIRQNGKLSVKADMSLDFESERDENDNPDGLIELRITIIDSINIAGIGSVTATSTLNVNIQLTNVNERPSGPVNPEPWNPYSIQLIYDDGDNIRKDYNPYSADRPRLLPGREFSINKSAFSDIDGDELHFKYIWSKATGGEWEPKAETETFTPTEAGIYKLYLLVSDRPLGSQGPLTGYGLEYNQSFQVYKPTPVIGTDTSISIDENAMRDSALATINLDDGGYRITGTYYIYSVNGHRMSAHPLFKMNDRGDALHLKTPETSLDYEDASSYEIVLRHDPTGSPRITYGDLTLTVNVNNVEESPVIKFRSNDQTFDLNADAIDGGGRIALSDPDISLINGPTDIISYTLSETRFLGGVSTDVTTSRFELELDTSQPWRGAPNGSTFYKIKALAEQTFIVGEIITLTITANDHNGNAGDTTATVTITILPPASPSQNGNMVNSQVQPLYSDGEFMSDAGMDELGMAQSDFL